MKDRPRWREVRDGEVLAVGTLPVDVDGKQMVLDEDEDEEAEEAEAARAAEATDGKDAAATAAAAALREAAAKLARMPEVDRLVWVKLERERLEVSDLAMRAAIREALTTQQAEAAAQQTEKGDTEFGPINPPEKTLDEAILRLASLDGAAYLTALADAAKTFNIKSPATLDRLVRGKRERQPPPTTAPGITLPRGFRLDETGLWFQPLPSHQSPEPAPVFVCGPFEVLGEARDLESRAWGVAIRWFDHDRRLHIWSCPQRLVHLDGNAIAAELADAGLSCGTSKQAHELLKQFLGALRTSERLQSAERGGWHVTLTNIGFVSPETTVITAERESP